MNQKNVSRPDDVTVEKKPKRKSYFMLFCMIAALLFLVCLYNGNPFSKFMATRHAQNYLKENYSDTDYEISAVYYSRGDGLFEFGYCADVTSPSSVDTQFTLALSTFRGVTSTTWENVENGTNTLKRANSQYTGLIQSVISPDLLSFEQGYCSGYLGDFWGATSQPCEQSGVCSLSADDLELDQELDLFAFSPVYGKIYIQISRDQPTFQRMAEVLLKAKDLLYEQGIVFHAASISISGYDPKNVRQSCFVHHILYDDITQDNLAARLEQMYDEGQASLNQ